MSMEYLIKNLGLDQVVMRLGLQTNFTKDNINENNITVNEREASKIKEDLKSSSYYHNSISNNDEMDYTDQNLSDDYN